MTGKSTGDIMSNIFSVVYMRESSSNYDGDHLSSEEMEFEYFHSFEEMADFYLKKEKRDWDELLEYNSKSYNHVKKCGLDWFYLHNGVRFGLIEDEKENEYWNEKLNQIQLELTEWKIGRREEIKNQKILEEARKKKLQADRRYQEFLALKKEFEGGNS